jgi:hypothetical protein
MSKSIDEIKEIEEQMVQAELGPQPEFFQKYLADESVLDGQKLKSRVVEAHKPGHGPKFTHVKMSDYEYADFGDAVVVTCKGEYKSEKWLGSLQFMRVWFKTPLGWQIIAGTTAPSE